MKVLIATPSYQHQVNNEMVLSLLRVIEDLRKRNISANWHSPVSSMLSFNRNLSVDVAINEGYDWLLFWDGDISVSEASFVHDMIDTAYKQESRVVGLPVALKGHPTTYNCTIGGGTNLTRLAAEPFEVSKIGTGVMLIQVSLFKAMIPPYFSFKDTHNGQAGCYPEDWGFCEFAAHHTKIYADPRFHVSHWGLHKYE